MIGEREKYIYIILGKRKRKKRSSGEKSKREKRKKERAGEETDNRDRKTEVLIKEGEKGKNK